MTALRRLARKLAREGRQRRRGFLAGLGQRTGPMSVEVVHVGAALAHPRWGRGVAEMIAEAAGTALAGVGQRACFCCDREWSPSRSLVLVVLVEWVADAPGAGVAAGICGQCAGSPDVFGSVLAGLRRDLAADPATVQLVHEGGRA